MIALIVFDHGIIRPHSDHKFSIYTFWVLRHRRTILPGSLHLNYVWDLGSTSYSTKGQGGGLLTGTDDPASVPGHWLDVDGTVF